MLAAGYPSFGLAEQRRARRRRTTRRRPRAHARRVVRHRNVKVVGRNSLGKRIYMNSTTGSRYTRGLHGKRRYI